VTRAIPSQPLLEVSNLQVQARSARGVANAVDGVSFSLRQGEVLGLIGESGSGKSLTCLSLIRLNPKPGTRITGGAVHFSGADLLAVDDEEMRAFRGRQIAMVLQDPMTALNPVLTIADQIGESLNLHQRLRGEAQTAEAERLLTQLRVPNPKRVLKSYPHQLSGGMRQRVVSAIALAGRPRLLIADEPTTALDVTVQAAYLKLLRNLQRESGLAVLFVTHDLAAIARICDRVAVMYGGRIVELADVATIFRAPKHPYTQGLLQSVPNVERPPQRMEAIPGHPPTIFSARKGCLFAPRCPEARAICSDQTPENVDIAPGHEVACWARRVN
jgi:oligopeptide/dipeptide ABC transporter ATP-binding protein